MSSIGTGCVHVYTGNGKGKTTAALGLALRASGAGFRVYIQQFLKTEDCCGIKKLRKIKNIKVGQCGGGPFVIGRPTVSDVECAVNGFAVAKKDIFSKKYDVVILDEINTAIKLGLIDVKEVKKMIVKKPKAIELILTGRGCPQAIKDMADIVTEMHEIRHPYTKGLAARRGIEF